MKNKEFWKVFWFIIKCTFIGFGGGNAIMPVIKKYAVDQYKWLDDEEFNNAIVAVNLIPGPAVIEMISYIAIKKLGKVLGIIVTLLAIMPHVLVVMVLFVLSSLLPNKYLFVLNIGVMPALIGVVSAFGYRYLKTSQKALSLPIWISLFLITAAFCLFVPAPFNLPAIPLVVVILIVFITEFIRSKRNKK
ncbi:chromate transporter [Mycoplasma procyoni]|uniref:chromate transporter n=1 Tax=Mycoplasma procyoni TaxID=568784 RepID=UPI00280AC611|nr:chromate transporter [Mycoplasma procyoni]